MAEGDNKESSSARGAGLIGPGGPSRHVLVFILCSIIVFIYDLLNGFERGVNISNPLAWLLNPTFQVYFVFMVIIALIYKLSWDMDEKQIGLFLGIYFFMWAVPIISFIPTWIIVIVTLAGPFYFMFILPHETTRIENFVKIAFIVIVLVVFFDSISEAAEKQIGTQGQEQIKQTRRDTFEITSKVVDAIRKAPTTFIEKMGGIKESIKSGWQRQIAFATGDYYTGQVDQNANEKLGVYIEDIKLPSPIIYEGEPVSIWAILKARTLGDKIVPVEVSCKTKNKDGDEINGYMDGGTEETSRKFEIAKMEEEDIDCNFGKYALDTGTYDIKFNAVFNFTTMAYLKTYFINKERLRSFTSEGIDVFDHYGITDKEPIAIHTAGPIMIGMGTTKPPIGLSTDYDNKPKIDITLDNNWEGKIKEIENLIVYIPDSIEIGSCLDSFEPYDDIKEEEKQEGYNAYKLRGEAKNSRGFKNIEQFITISCKLNIPSYKVNSFLGGKAPITTRYLKVTADYVYELEKGISVSIKTPKDFNVRIKETKPTSGIPLNCYGKHPDKKLKKAFCNFYEIKDEREDLVAEKIPAVCSDADKACNCVLNKNRHETKRGQIIKCTMIATIKTDKEEEKESDSDSVTIRNSPPEIFEGIIMDEPVVNEDLLCIAIIEDSDNDQITATYEFSGDYAETGNAVCDILDEGDEFFTCYVKIDGYKVVEGASITCKIVPNDELVNGKEKTKTVTVKGVEAET